MTATRKKSLIPLMRGPSGTSPRSVHYGRHLRTRNCDKAPSCIPESALTDVGKVPGALDLPRESSSRQFSDGDWVVHPDWPALVHNKAGTVGYFLIQNNARPAVECYANARLCAAAPDMINFILDWLDLQDGVRGNGLSHGEMLKLATSIRMKVFTPV